MVQKQTPSFKYITGVEIQQHKLQRHLGHSPYSSHIAISLSKTQGGKNYTPKMSGKKNNSTEPAIRVGYKGKCWKCLYIKRKLQANQGGRKHRSRLARPV